MANCGPCWSILWIILIIIIAWPVGFFCAAWYLFLSPFAACCNAFDPIVDILETGLKLPLSWAQNAKVQIAMC